MFSNVKEGDKFFVYDRNYTRIGEATNITGTRFEVLKQKFRKNDGYLVGASRYDFSHVKIATDKKITEFKNKIAEKNKKTELLSKIDKFKIRDFSVKKLEELLLIMDNDNV